MIDVVVISLVDAIERRRHIQSAFEAAGVDFRFFDAVNGRALNEADLKSCNPAMSKSGFKRPLSLPEIGCYLSHYRIWQSICQTKAAWTIVLEDDSEIKPSFAGLLSEIAALRLDPAIIQLNDTNSTVIRRLARLTERHELVELWIARRSSCGYAINHAGAQQMARLALPFSRPIDIDMKHWWEFGIEMLAVKPSVVRERPGTLSGIEQSRIATKLQFSASGVRGFFDNLLFQLRFKRGLVRARLAKFISGNQQPKTVVRPDAR